MKYKIPATSANLGPGFDSFGMALDLYNYVEIKEVLEFEKGDFQKEKNFIGKDYYENYFKIIVKGKGSNEIPLNNENLAYKVMKSFYNEINKKIRNVEIKIENEIPVARGLGSSASIIIGTILALNDIENEILTKEEILKLALKIEKHLDNITPCLYGGFNISMEFNNEIIHKKIKVDDNLKAVLFIPSYEISTLEARKILKKDYKLEDVVFNIKRAALEVLSFEHREYKALNYIMKDRIHEPFRKKLIKEFDIIEKIMKENGAITTNVSGSGSTIISFFEKEIVNKVYDSLEKQVNNKNLEGELKLVSIVNEGAKKIC